MDIAKLWRSRAGNIAVMSGLLSVPLLLAVGLSVDYSRYVSATASLQEANDAVALALAASKERNEAKLTLMAADVLQANKSPGRLEQAVVASVKSTDEKVDVSLTGSIPVTFMGLAGYRTLDARTSATAERAVVGGVELALILDNTTSMEFADTKGVKKIDAVKAAATKLVGELMKGEDGAVKVALVPFADYVNVGTENRLANWLDIPAEYTKTSPGKCETKTTRSECVSKQPTYSCTKMQDGVEYQATCGGGCNYEPKTVPPYESCSNAAVYNYRWYGCVGSRVVSSKPVNDDSGSARYPGLLHDVGPVCPTPIIPLTTSKSTIEKGIAGMITRRSSPWYLPNTYLPAGVMWGLNTLSPSEPMSQGAAYDANNQKPRKVAVLMTDGENTKYLKLTDWDAGRHYDMAAAYDGAGNYVAKNAETAKTQVAVTNKDTLEMCASMKAKGIEIFSVAFMIEDAEAKKLLETCATDPKTNYFDASDSDKLAAAFGTIGNSLRVVRLAR